MTQTPTKTPEKRSVIDLLCESLNAQKTDLTQLSLYVNRKKATKQLHQGLIRQAFARLGQLRQKVADLGAAVSDESHLHVPIMEASALLQLDIPLSLEKVGQCLADIVEAHSTSSNPVSADITATISEIHALFFSLTQDHQNAAESYASAAAVNGISAQEKWRFQMLQAEVLEDLGRDFGISPSLNKAIKLIETDILPLVDKQTRPEDWSATQHRLGNVLGILGQRQGGTRNIEDAITTLEASLSVRDRKKEPLLWAETQNSLGNALGILGLRQKDEVLLEKCVSAFERALEERTREKTPHEWAITKNNLASVLQSIGQKNKDTKQLNAAVDAYKEVLEEWTRERAPLDWASAMNNLGTGLRLLGEHRKGPRTLEQSVAAYKSALSERSREQFPAQWAMIQNNLGAALQKLAEKESNEDTLRQSISAYENALQEWTRERSLMSWAMTTANLGVARRTLAEVTSDYAIAIEAVEELDSVSTAFREASHAQYSELIIDQLAQARKLADVILQQQKEKPERLDLY